MLHERFFRQNAPPLRLVKDSGCRGRSLAWRGLQAGTAFLATRQNLCQVSTYRPTWYFRFCGETTTCLSFCLFPRLFIRYASLKENEGTTLDWQVDVMFSSADNFISDPYQLVQYRCWW